MRLAGLLASSGSEARRVYANFDMPISGEADADNGGAWGARIYARRIRRFLHQRAQRDLKGAVVGHAAAKRMCTNVAAELHAADLLLPIKLLEGVIGVSTAGL